MGSKEKSINNSRCLLCAVWLVGQIKNQLIRESETLTGLNIDKQSSLAHVHMSTKDCKNMELVLRIGLMTFL